MPSRNIARMSQKRVAFLTMQDPGDYVTDYDLCYAALADVGWEVETVAWRDTGIDWNRFDAVYPCTAWDYPQHLQEFVAVLQRIEASSATLINELALLQWNIRKSYLRDLEARGAAIVPSIWLPDINGADAAKWFAKHQTDTLVIKPEVGANAQDAFVLRNPVDADTWALLSKAFYRRGFLVQPFVDSIGSEGEYSLFYFAGQFSHAILKIPTAGDFRSQEEYGARIQSVEPEAGLLAAADGVVELLRPQPVYVRVDLVRGADGRFLLMELELIEPSLYFRTDDASPARFAAAFDQHFREHSK